MALGKVKPPFLQAPATISTEGSREDPQGLLHPTTRKVIKIIGGLPSPAQPILKPILSIDKLIEIIKNSDTGAVEKIRDVAGEMLPSSIDLVLTIGSELLDSPAGEIAKGLSEKLWDALKNPPQKDPETGKAQELTLDQLPELPDYQRQHTSNGGGERGRITRQRQDYHGITPEIDDPTWYYMIDDNNLYATDIERFRDEYYENTEGATSFKEFVEKRLAEKQNELKVGTGDEFTGRGSVLAYQKQNATAENIIKQILNLKKGQEIIFEAKTFSIAPLIFLFLLS